MKSPLRVFSLAAIAVLSISVNAAGIDKVPSVILDPYSPWPAWVAADVAVAPDGTLREDQVGQFIPALRRVALLNTAALAKEEGTADLSAEGGDLCRIFRGPPAYHIIRTSSLDDLMNHAGVIVSGEILAGRQGFLGGLPGTLYAVAAHYLKGEPVRETLFFYPHARISTADGMICARAPGVSGPPPQAGDRVLIFFLAKPRVEYGRVILSVAADRELVHESRGAGTHVPASLRSFAADPAPIDAITRAVIAAGSP
jgi:hypothetical protein